MSVKSEIDRIVNEVSTQSDLINQIAVTLQGKTGGGSSGSGGASIETGTFTVTEDMYEPGITEYVLTSSNLKADSRTLILVGCTTPNGLDSIFVTFRRNNTSEEFTRYDGDMNIFVISHTSGVQKIENDSTVVLYGGPSSNRTIETMYYIAV